MTHMQADDKPLRWVLLANALFSAASGLALVIAPESISALFFAKTFALFGLAPATLVLELGIGLLIFAGFVAFTARQKTLSLGQAKLIVLADLLWVVDSAAALAVFPDFLSPIGFYGVSITAVIVLILALDQIWGIAQIARGAAISRSRPGKTASPSPEFSPRTPG